MRRLQLTWFVVAGCGRIGYEYSAGSDSGLPDATVSADSGAGDAESDGGSCSWTIELERRGSLNDGSFDTALEWERDGTIGHVDYPVDGLYFGTTRYGLAYGYFRFHLPVAVTTDIRTAELSLWGVGTSFGWGDGTADAAVIVYAEDSPNPPQVTVVEDNPARPGGRELTTLGVRWPTTGSMTWQVDAYNRVDVAALLNDLVARHGGLSSGANVQFWITGLSAAGGGVAGTEDSSLGPAYHPALLEVDACSM